jgi:hypothetical protein
MGTAVTNPSRRQAPAVVPHRPHCNDCGDFGLIGDLKAVGDRNGFTYVELANAIHQHNLAFCACPAGDFQSQFLEGMCR